MCISMCGVTCGLKCDVVEYHKLVFNIFHHIRRQIMLLYSTNFGKLLPKDINDIDGSARI